MIIFLCVIIKICDFKLKHNFTLVLKLPTKRSIDSFQQNVSLTLQNKSKKFKCPPASASHVSETASIPSNVFIVAPSLGSKSKWQTTLDGSTEKCNMHTAIADLIYSTGLPFGFAREPSSSRFFVGKMRSQRLPAA